jgi:predicted nucleic acid-binding protein
MMYILDTDIFIDIQRGHAPAVEWFRSLQVLPLVPGYVVMELIQDAQNMLQVRQAMQLVAPLSIVWPSASDCSRALSDFRNYHLSHNLGLLDALIGASAVGISAQLCTFNVKHYRVIRDLVTAQPYSR